MEEELEIGKSYTVNELLNFLEENYRENIFLQSTKNINLLSLPREDKYIVHEIKSAFIHKFKRNPDTGNVGYQMNTDFRVYLIKPE